MQQYTLIKMKNIASHTLMPNIRGIQWSSTQLTIGYQVDKQNIHWFRHGQNFHPVLSNPCDKFVQLLTWLSNGGSLGPKVDTNSHLTGLVQQLAKSWTFYKSKKAISGSLLGSFLASCKEMVMGWCQCRCKPMEYQPFQMLEFLSAQNFDTLWW